MPPPPHNPKERKYRFVADLLDARFGRVGPHSLEETEAALLFEFLACHLTGGDIPGIVAVVECHLRKNYPDALAYLKSNLGNIGRLPWE